MISYVNPPVFIMNVNCFWKQFFFANDALLVSFHEARIHVGYIGLFYVRR